MAKVTLAAGRFLLDLPADARAHFGRQAWHGLGGFIHARKADPEAAEDLVTAHANLLLGAPHEEGGTQLERIMAGPRPHSWLLFHWRDTAFKDELLVCGYGWLDGVLFCCRCRCEPGARAMAAQRERWAEAFRQLRRRDNLEMPKEPGFCIQDGYFRGGSRPGAREHLELLVDFPSRRDLLVRLCTDTLGPGLGPGPTVLSPARDPAGECPCVRLRAVGPFLGLEGIKREGRGPGSWSTTFFWECPGIPQDPLGPRIRLEMTTGWGRSLAAADQLPAAEAAGRWEQLLASLRPYPQARPLQVRIDRTEEKTGHGPQVAGA